MRLSFPDVVTDQEVPTASLNSSSTLRCAACAAVKRRMHSMHPVSRLRVSTSSPHNALPLNLRRDSSLHKSTPQILTLCSGSPYPRRPRSRFGSNLFLQNPAQRLRLLDFRSSGTTAGPGGVRSTVSHTLTRGCECHSPTVRPIPSLVIVSALIPSPKFGNSNRRTISTANSRSTSCLYGCTTNVLHVLVLASRKKLWNEDGSAPVTSDDSQLIPPTSGRSISKTVHETSAISKF